jgi:hypothetical protein
MRALRAPTAAHHGVAPTTCQKIQQRLIGPGRDGSSASDSTLIQPSPLTADQLLEACQPRCFSVCVSPSEEDPVGAGSKPSNGGKGARSICDGAPKPIEAVDPFSVESSGDVQESRATSRAVTTRTMRDIRIKGPPAQRQARSQKLLIGGLEVSAPGSATAQTRAIC